MIDINACSVPSADKQQQVAGTTQIHAVAPSKCVVVLSASAVLPTCSHAHVLCGLVIASVAILYPAAAFLSSVPAVQI